MVIGTRHLSTLGAIAAVLFCATAIPTHAGNSIVANTNDSGPGSLRQALADATDGDTITFAVTGTIGVTTGELLVDKDVTISGPGPGNLAVDGNASSRVFHISPGTGVAISGLTIRNGVATGGYADDRGAGIYNDHATLTLDDCAISGNSASYGGGIYNDAYNADPDPVYSAVLTINNSVFSDNSASYSGGGIDSYVFHRGEAVVTINNSTFTGNSAGYRGGGVGNSSVDYPTEASTTLNNCMLIGNSAGVEGGGISNFVGSGGYATLEVNSSTLTGNAASNGGGVSNNADIGEALLQVSNSTMSNNSAQAGGGINNESDNGSASAYISHSTFSGNSASHGGAIFYSEGGIYIAMINTILNAGVSGENIYAEQGSVMSLGYNLSSDDGGGYLTGPGDQINTDPLLGPLQGNGGPTLTHALLPGSPAVNTGDPNFSPPPLYDQRGLGFDRMVNGRVDIGSFEMQGPNPTPTPSPRVRSTPTPRQRPTPAPRPSATP